MLEHLTQQATRAFDGTSFSPERRGAETIREHTLVLTGDIKEIEAAAEKYGVDCSDVVSRYKVRFERLFTHWLHARSNCISTMIAGPSKFPIRRAEKANNSEHNRYQELSEWRIRCKRAIIRGFKPKETPVTELEKAKHDLLGREKFHEIMKQANVIIRRAKRTDCTPQLVAIGLTESQAKKLQGPDFLNRIGFPTYQLTNNNANIKRLQARVKELERKVEKQSTANKELEVSGVKVVEDYQEDRLQLFFPKELYVSFKTELKPHLAGWNFSKANGNCWQRKITQNAKYSASHIINEIKKLTENEHHQGSSPTD